MTELIDAARLCAPHPDAGVARRRRCALLPDAAFAADWSAILLRPG